MIEEKEILTILSEDEYKQVLSRLEKEFGKPKMVKRLSLQSTDYRWADVDTRIRITNGVAEIIQKVGDWKDNLTRTEIIIPLPSDPKIIFDMYKIFRNAMRDEKVLTPIMQYENRLFKQRDLEVKLTYQFGKKDAYNCEVEVFDATLEPENITKKYDIPIHLPAHTPDFWKNWNETVNLSATEFSDEELFKIISKYL
ncbi:MAG: hypothetical protein US96_C0012G0016 [Candidatus Woesebacteria bacterium GW2011_GWB1_38_5b]|uniref:CYTH domain-containing protein n=1 Tax=Candidatus Woesebacteria bacterium GW2011_GWB1_38_5b TaxID=1618569 RepID=A0A0G0K954_9BACT|nr:MAG: hypothetical protein US96_C0012G0016 [Candidatus Woesebacteria bacterium GW2011_GWB1_38_5b]